MNLEIIPNEGIGTLRFGATPSDVKAVLGSPAFIDNAVDKIKKHAIRWVYDVPDISLMFHSGGSLGLDPHPSRQKRLFLIWTRSKDVTLFGERVVGREVEPLIALLKSHAMEFYAEREESVPGKSLVCRKLNLSVNVVNELVLSIQWTNPLRPGAAEALGSSKES